MASLDCFKLETEIKLFLLKNIYWIPCVLIDWSLLLYICFVLYPALFIVWLYFVLWANHVIRSDYRSDGSGRLLQRTRSLSDELMIFNNTACCPALPFWMCIQCANTLIITVLKWKIISLQFTNITYNLKSKFLERITNIYLFF
jgi:hypothetical protein